MKLIVGLGNPGLRYSGSRHNIGFSIVKSLAKDHAAALRKDKYAQALSVKVKIEDQDIVLAMPLTYMNLSGAAVSALVKRYKIDLGDILVVCDDLDLELGRIKIRPSGSSGGHRGLQSIIEALGSNGFCRLRIGIGRSQEFIEAAEYVLASFRRNEKGVVKEAIENASSCCEVWVKEGVVECMNLFNGIGKYKTLS